MKKQPKKYRNDLSIILAIIITICLMGIGMGYFYSQLPENNPQKSQENCEKAGGEWQKNNEKCLLSYRADGEACTDGGQCQSGICFPPALTEEQMTILANGNLSGVIGTCYTDNSAEGCIKQVNDGTVSMKSLCY
jgi:hypothetical protein